MIRRILLLILLCMSSSIVAVSCGYDTRELDHRSMIVGLAIDKAEEEDKLLISFQLPILGLGAEVSPRQKDFEVISSSDKSVMEAITNIETVTPRALFFGHLKVVAISRDVAEENLSEVLDLLERHPQIGNQVYLLIIEDTPAKDFLSMKTPLIALPSLYVDTFFKARQKTTRTTDIQIFEYLRDSQSASNSSYIPMARISNGEASIHDLAILKDHQMVGVLRGDEAGCGRLLKELSLEEKRYSIQVKGQGGEVVTINLAKIDLKLDMKYRKTKPVEFDLSIKGSGFIRGTDVAEDVITDKLITTVEKSVNKAFEAEYMAVIKKMQKINAEPFLFGQYILATDHDYFESLNWNETGWKKAKFNINVNFKVENTGTKNDYDKKKIR